MSNPLLVGVTVVDVTPRDAAMAGFVARTKRSTGVHDPITVRSLVVDRTVLIAVDVCGFDGDFCRRVAERVSASTDIPAEGVIVHAIHTHGGPSTMFGGADVDDAWMQGLESACVDGTVQAWQQRAPARMFSAEGRDTGIAHNRRRDDGPVDDVVSVIGFENDEGPIAMLLGYACHPVVLGPDNTLLTADYPWSFRAGVEAAMPGVTAVFVTGCAGDANNGSHSPEASFTLAPNELRSFAEAERIGQHLAQAALEAARSPVEPSNTGLARVDVECQVDLPDHEQLARERDEFADLAATEEPQRALFENWTQWAAGELETTDRPDTWTGSVTVLAWGDARVIALPGEPFAAAAHALRAATDRPLIIVGYANGCPGYFPSRDEYPHGGYEVCDAHRYYGANGPFAGGSLEILVDAALGALKELAS